MTEDFLIRFKNLLVDKYTQLPPEWCTQLSHVTLASVLNRDVWLKTKIGKNRCNVWPVLFAPSGRGYKSTPADNIILPILSAVGNKTEKYFILPSIASSIEGIIDRARDEKVGMSGLIYRDEFTSFLKEGETKAYTVSWESYSKMYDGWLFTRSTRQVQVYRMIPVYVNLLGATTPKYAYNVLNVGFFFQGIGNRIEPFYHNPPGKEDYTVDDLFEQMKWNDVFGGDKIDPELTPFVEELITISKEDRYITMDSEAMEVATKYKNELGRKINAIPEDSVLAFKREFYERNYQKALKHAQIITVAKDHDKEELIILPEYIEEGIKIVRESEKYFETIVEDWLGTPQESKERMANDLAVLFSYLHKVKVYGVISQKKLAFEVGNTRRNKEFYSYVNFLEQSGCIRIIRDSTSICHEKGKEWMEEQMISPSFRVPPVLYDYVKPLSQKTQEEVTDHGIKRD